MCGDFPRCEEFRRISAGTPNMCKGPGDCLGYVYVAPSSNGHIYPYCCGRKLYNVTRCSLAGGKIMMMMASVAASSSEVAMVGPRFSPHPGVTWM